MGKETLKWIPLNVDSVLYGSMAIDLTLEEQGIWWRVLALSAKDNGYIRANETTAYKIEQIAGLLMVDKDKLLSAIEKFKINDAEGNPKITEENGIYKITKWEQYRLSSRYRRRLMSAKTDTSSAKTDTSSEKSGLNIEKSKEEKSIVKKSKEEERKETEEEIRTNEIASKLIACYGNITTLPMKPFAQQVNIAFRRYPIERLMKAIDKMVEREKYKPSIASLKDAIRDTQ